MKNFYTLAFEATHCESLEDAIDRALSRGWIDTDPSERDQWADIDDLLGNYHCGYKEIAFSLDELAWTPNIAKKFDREDYAQTSMRIFQLEDGMRVVIAHVHR